MNWTRAPGAEKAPGQLGRHGREAILTPGYSTQTDTPPSGIPSALKALEIRIGKCLAFSAIAGAPIDVEVFTMTLGSETIELLPQKNWHQLDHHKWTVQGKLPGEPTGLEVALDHVKVAGGIVALKDPAGCLKLEQLFNEWLVFERETVELTRKKACAQAAASTQQTAAQAGAPPLHFHVEMDKRGQVHIHCLRGKEPVASVGLNAAGINSLHQQGLMRKPHKLATGALHDWVELDGELCSFEKGVNDAAKLEQLLNKRYLPEATAGRGKEVVIYLNPASSTGFDIQFPVMVAGVPNNHRHHLNDKSLESLQDHDHCGLLHREIIVKLIPPNLVFKRKTSDGGEQYLPWNDENSVTITDEEGHEKTLHLTQPLNLLHLSAAELTAVFNHPVINRHTKAGKQGITASGPAQTTASPTGWASWGSTDPAPTPPKQEPVPQLRAEQPKPEAVQPKPAAPAPASPSARSTAGVSTSAPARSFIRSLPNMWLKDVLAQPALPHDWFSVLTYTKLAERFGNSNEGKFGPCDCWYISLGETEDIAGPEFKGVFITEKGSLGFLSAGQMARFYNRIAFIGPQDSALEGIEVDLIGMGLDEQGRVVFVLSDDYRAQFGVRAATLGEVLNRMREHGAVILGVKELLANPDPIEVLWTVPAEQEDPSSPAAWEATRPS
jgi:hypothetical protein